MLQGQKIAQIEKLAAQRLPNATKKKCYNLYIKWSFKHKKMHVTFDIFWFEVLKIYVTTRYIAFWNPAKIVCLLCSLFSKSRPGRSKIQLNSAKQSLRSIECKNTLRFLSSILTATRTYVSHNSLCKLVCHASSHSKLLNIVRFHIQSRTKAITHKFRLLTA